MDSISITYTYQKMILQIKKVAVSWNTTTQMQTLVQLVQLFKNTMLIVGKDENQESSPTEAYIQWQNPRSKETGENQEQRYENSQGDEVKRLEQGHK